MIYRMPTKASCKSFKISFNFDFTNMSCYFYKNNLVDTWQLDCDEIAPQGKMWLFWPWLIKSLNSLYAKTVSLRHFSLIELSPLSIIMKPPHILRRTKRLPSINRLIVKGVFNFDLVLSLSAVVNGESGIFWIRDKANPFNHTVHVSVFPSHQKCHLLKWQGRRDWNAMHDLWNLFM